VAAAAEQAINKLTSKIPMDRKIVLKAQQLTKKVNSPEGELTIVDDVSLEIAAGETVALVGASGAGKSTLLAILAGLDVPTHGQVWLDGQELTAMDEDQRAQLRADRAASRADRPARCACGQSGDVRASGVG
jgi:predicted ABC-type transport system involved in lysophospholipase L1 biosynthesis ATPase subunit